MGKFSVQKKLDLYFLKGNMDAELYTEILPSKFDK